MKLAKRTLALVLVVMMVATVMVMPASAAGSDWEGYFRSFRQTSQYNYISGYAAAVQSILMGFDETSETISKSGGVDGMFGAKTAEAVEDFQYYNGLGDDGIVGPDTWGKMACKMGESSGRILKAGTRQAIKIRYEQSLYKFYYYNTAGTTYSADPFHNVNA